MAPKYIGQNTGDLFPDGLDRHESIEGSDYCESCDGLYSYEDLCEVCGFCLECCDGDCIAEEAEDDDDDDDASIDFEDNDEDDGDNIGY